jgi:hypothetical protein
MLLPWPLIVLNNPCAIWVVRNALHVRHVRGGAAVRVRVARARAQLAQCLVHRLRGDDARAAFQGRTLVPLLSAQLEQLRGSIVRWQPAVSRAGQHRGTAFVTKAHFSSTQAALSQNPPSLAPHGYSC